MSCIIITNCNINWGIITESWRLRDYSRWVFRKNLMEFSVGFGYLLILLYKWLYPYYYMITCPSRIFYNHMIWLPNLPMLFISWLHYVTWYWRSNVQMCGKLFPFQGSHNTRILLESCAPVALTIEAQHMSWGQGCSPLLLSIPFHSRVTPLHSRLLCSCFAHS